VTDNTNTSAYYTVTYNTNANYAAGLVPSINIKASGKSPPKATYARLTITAQSSEKVSKAAIGSEDKSVDIVFRLANTRPYFANTNDASNKLNSDPLITLEPGGTGTLDISKLVYDLDDASLTATFAMGTNNLKVPTNEYIQVDMSNVVVPLKATSNYAPAKSNGGGNSSNNAAVSTSSTTGEGSNPTGFRTGAVALAGSAGASTANITYTYVNNKTIQFTARAATQYMYKQANRLGDFYVLVRVIDPSDPDDAGMWYPIALRVKSAAPTETPTVANVSLSFDFTAGTADNINDKGTDASDRTPESVVLSPMSYLSNGQVVALGSTSIDGTAKDNVIPFVSDADSITYSGVSVLNNNSNVLLNDVAVINEAYASGATRFTSAIDAHNTETFFSITPVDLYVGKEYFDAIGERDLLASGAVVRGAGNAESYYVFKGIRITPLRSTSNDYFRIDVNVKEINGDGVNDADGKTNSTVRILVNVQNRAVSPRRSSYTDNGATVNIPENFPINSIGNEYIANKNIGAIAVNYRIERNDVLQITPYDFVYDFDMDRDNSKLNTSKSNLNTNPADKGFGEAADFILAKYNVLHSATPTVAFGNEETSAVTAQQLYFANPDTLVNTARNQYGNYITLSVENTCTAANGANYAIPCIKITGASRTTSAIVQLRFTVTDGFSTVDITITVTVSNSKPTLNSSLKPFYSMSVDGKRASDKTLEFLASSLAYDKDGDTPTFVPGSIGIVAKTGNSGNDEVDYVEQFTENGKTYTLSDYVSAALTKDGRGEDVIFLTALSSTQLIQHEVFLMFKVQDGYRADPQISTLYLPIEVLNSDPTPITDSLVADDDGDYTWLIQWETTAEKYQTKYIANSKALYDVLPGSATNKTYLFDEPDAKQTVLLDHGNDGTITAPSLIARANKDASDDDLRKAITSSNNETHPAIVHTPAYPEDASKAYLGMEVIFYDADLQTTTDTSAPYWALQIKDSQSSTTSVPVHIAFAIKDDHTRQSLKKRTDSGLENSAEGNNSDSVWLDFYFEFQSPRITAMHEYYRTDGNKESQTYVDESLTGDALKADTNYLVSVGAIGGNDGVQSYHFENGVVPTQANLVSARFTEEFQYLYFVKTITKEGQSGSSALKDVSLPTYKHFPASADKFKYEPVSVGGTSVDATVVVPMSYIAMPAGGTQETERGSHVTLANATTGALGGNNVLVDSAYESWGDDSTLPYVLSNVRLSDSLGNSWGYGTGKPLSDNDYLDIGYDSDSKYLDTKYLNTHRKVLEKTSDGKVSLNDVTFKYTAQDVADAAKDGVTLIEGASIFREDKYGFTFHKKEGGNRAPGMLTFSVAVKATGSKDDDVELISMNIILENSDPKLEYNYPNSPNLSTIDGMITDLDVNMTTSDVNGKTVNLVDRKSVDQIDRKDGVYTIYYTDADYTDVMKFKLSSAIGVRGMTDKEYAHLDSANMTFNNEYAPTTYFGSGSDKDNVAANFEPNPGYSKFFTVSPTESVSSSLQFIPVAKTQLNNINLNQSDEDLRNDLKEYNLDFVTVGSEKKIYYPFKIIFYDEVAGSTFAEGSWALAVIRVFIDNDPVTVTDSIKDTHYYSIRSDAAASVRDLPYYEFSLSKNTNFFVDVSSLLVDNDIPVVNGSLVASDEDMMATLPTGYNEALYGHTKDYLKMPTTYEVLRSEGNGPIDVFMTEEQKNDAGISVSDTTIVFKAKSAFKGRVDYLFTFDDSVRNDAAECKVIFSILYNNEKPTPNSATFGGTDTYTIRMKSGQSFTLLAADADEFDKQNFGGFPSYGNVFQSYKYNDAKALAQNFGTDDGTGYLGALVLGSDDAATTLRLRSSHNRENFEPRSAYDSFKFTENSVFAWDYNTNANLPMAVTYTVNGVVNATLSVVLTDGMGEETTVYINIIVESTPPKANTTVRPTDTNGKLSFTDQIKNDDGTTVTKYGVTLNYGGTASVRLSDLMTDDDAGDSNKFSVYKNLDGSMFNIQNPEGVSAVDVKLSDTAMKEVVINATDFIPTKDETVKISFRVCDEWGAVSDEIIIEVTIKPQSVSSLAADTARKATVKSYADYLAEGTAFTLDIVTSDRNNSTALFYDADTDADSAAYDVAVYGMYDYSSSGNRFERIGTQEFKSKSDDELARYLIGSTSAVTNIINNSFVTNVTQQRGPNGATEITDVYNYIRRFFTIDIADDGKSIEFTPVTATLSANQNSVDLDELSLYVVVNKRSIDANVASDNKNVSISNAKSLLNVSVENSGVVAVSNSPYNAGYPKITTTVEKDGVVSTEEIFRDSEFLSFTGTTGDSLTWKLFMPYDEAHNNSTVRDRGLFYDYDMLNFEQSDMFVSREALDYNRDYVVRGVTEAVTVSTPILSVSFDENTHDLTIKINRKVYTGQPPKDGYENSYTEIYVDIYCGDTLAKRSGNKNNYVKNTITVRVENGIPEIKATSDFTAEENKPDYVVTYTEAEGYVLEKSLERGASLKLNIPDIIKDSDIAMDEYVLVPSGSAEYSLMGSDGYLMGSNSASGTNDGIGRLGNGSETLFTVGLTTDNNAYKINTLSAITFTCESTARGAVAVCELRFRDSVKTAFTSVLTVRLTVDNIRPEVKSGANLTVTVMGAGKDATEEDVANNIRSFNIINYISDANGDAYVAGDVHTAEGVQPRTPTYAFIDEIAVYTIDEADPSLRPSIYGPLKDGDGTPDAVPATTVCSIDWAEDDVHHQTFRVIPSAGVYGVQKIALKITDSGFVLGSQDGVLDGKSLDLVLTVIVANPLEDVGDLPTVSIGYGITRTITIDALLGEENAQGYEIADIVEDGTNNLTVLAPGTANGAVTSAVTAPSTDNWRIYAKTPSTLSNVKVTFRAGGITTAPRNMPVQVVANNPPEPKANRTSYEYTVDKLDDPYNRTLKIYPEDWFDDFDEEDIMRFVDPVVSSQSVIVNAIIDYDDMADGGRPYILLTFNRSGASDITFYISDLSGTLYSKTITVNCTDAPELSWWENFISIIEANWMWFWIIVACILLFLILLIILIIVIVKKRRVRREIEALLESETELEEEMMRLNAAGMAQYQSFGYLPPTQQTVADTGFMIGGGQSAPMQDSLQLNAGTGATPTQTVQINSVPGSAPVNSMPGTRPASSTSGNMRPSMSMPGNAAQQRRQVPPQQSAQPQNRQVPPANNDGFDPDEF